MISRPRLEELVRHGRAWEPQAACHAVRGALGLRVSSNRVEKANDLAVFSRQKHGGTGRSGHAGRLPRSPRRA